MTRDEGSESEFHTEEVTPSEDSSDYSFDVPAFNESDLPAPNFELPDEFTFDDRGAVEPSFEDADLPDDISLPPDPVFAYTDDSYAEAPQGSDEGEGAADQPVDDYAAPVDDYVEPVEDYTAPAEQDYTAPVEQDYTAEPVAEYSVEPIAPEPAEDYVEPANDYAEPVEDYAPPADDYTAPVEQEPEPEPTYATDAFVAPTDTIPADATTTSVFPPMPNADAGDGMVPPIPVGDDDMNKPKKSRKKLWFILASVLILVVLAGSATAYGLYYKGKALPHTMMGDVPVGGMTKAQIVDMVNDTQKNAKLTLTGDVKKTTVVSLKDVGVTMNATQTANDVMSANDSFLSWVKAPFSTRTVPVAHRVDRAKLADFTQKLSEEADDGSLKPTEPVIEHVTDSDDFKIVPGKSGVGLEPRDVQKVAQSAMDTQKSAKGTVKKTHEIAPLIKVKELEPLKKRAEELIEPAVVIKVGDKNVEAPKKAKAEWVKLPLPGSLKEPEIDKNSVAQWLAEASGPLVVNPVNGYAYVTESGKTLKMETNPKDGVKVTNIDAMAKSVTGNMMAGKKSDEAAKTAVDKAVTKKKVVADGAENLPYWASPDEIWIDVNVGGRLVTVYKGATVLRGPMGMVPGDAAHPTVRGTFKIWYRTRVQTMTGPGYTTPNVEFNSFFHQGYAIHAAYWRSAFGPGTGGGSHGCVNMSRSDAEWIYKHTGIGTVVVSRN